MYGASSVRKPDLEGVKIRSFVLSMVSKAQKALPNITYREEGTEGR